eukprot:6573820-Pyramimonas_sp.AAC.1
MTALCKCPNCWPSRTAPGPTLARPSKPDTRAGLEHRGPCSRRSTKWCTVPGRACPCSLSPTAHTRSAVQAGCQSRRLARTWQLRRRTR